MNGKELSSKLEEESKSEKNSVLPDDGNNGETRKGLNKRDEDDKSSKKKKTKKKKDKSKKQTKKKEENELVSKNTETTNREQEQEIVAVPSQSTNHADDKKKERNLPGCFGFISTWLARRRQKRREKKKKAIADRATSPESGKQKIMKTPVVQPVKQTGGPIRREDYYRLKKAEARREDELAERCRSRIDCKERKAKADNHFSNQTDADRNCINFSCLESSSCESVISESDPDAWRVDYVDLSY